MAKEDYIVDCYLLDTNAISAIADGSDKDHDRIWNYLRNQMISDYLFICRIACGEIEYGLKLFVASDAAIIERRKRFREGLKAYSVKEISRHTIGPYSDIRSALFKKFAARNKRGKVKTPYPESLVEKTTARELSIQENDIWIAAIAVEFNMILLTADDKFRHIKDVWPDFRVSYWQ